MMLRLPQSPKILSLCALALVLTGCGGGGDAQGGNITAVNPSSAATVTSSSTTSSTATSVAINSSATQASSIGLVTTTSSAQSSYVRASRASSSSADFPDDDKPGIPEEPDNSFDLPPSAPSAAHLDVISATGATLSWQASTDDLGISRYEIRRDGVVAGTTSATKLSFEDTGLAQNTYYTYTVRAIDSAGNRSNFSNAVIAKTLINTSSSAASSSQPASSSAGNSSSTSSAANSNSSLSSNTSSSRSSSSSNVTSSSSTNSSSSSSSSPANTVHIEWITPSRRENGDYLELNEIGGYELRHKPYNSGTFSSQIIDNRHTNNLDIANATLGDTFEIAVFDNNGLYSRFVRLNPH